MSTVNSINVELIVNIIIYHAAVDLFTIVYAALKEKRHECLMMTNLSPK